MVHHDHCRVHVRTFHINLRFLQKVYGRLLGRGRDKGHGGRGRENGLGCGIGHGHDRLLLLLLWLLLRFRRLFNDRGGNFRTLITFAIGSVGQFLVNLFRFFHLSSIIHRLFKVIS